MDAYQSYNTSTNAGPPPPPPSISEFQHEQLQHQRPPAPPLTHWYPGQNNYQPALQPPPPPPPGMQNPYAPQQWGPHPTENHTLQGYPPPPPAFPNQHYSPHQFPPPNRPQMHPLPYHHSQVPPQPYSAGHQAWGNSNWPHHQGYEYPGQSNQDDWAARARAWAAAKAAMDNQQQLLPFSQGIRTELQTQLHDQYAYVGDPQHLETKPGSYPVAYPHNPYGSENHQHVPIPDGQSNNAPGGHLLPKDGSLGNESKATVHQQEVSSSYSSISGREVGTNQNQMQFKSFPGPSNALQSGRKARPVVPTVDGPDLLGSSFSYHNQNGDLSDKPLDFATRANISSIYPHPDSTGHHRGVESSTIMPVNHSWAPHLAPGSIYPSAANSGSQFDPSISAHSPVPGQVPPIFGTIAGTIIQPALPSVSDSFGPGNGSLLVTPTTFPVDAYGSSSASDRPKKASVPNWLKEEIIKKKAVMATSAHDYRQEETQSLEHEIGNQSFGKDDQAEGKSMDSSRSTEEEDDEDYVEAARTAAINKEIKRVLTEVLLKVTDDLFDEIATKVLSEDDIINDASPNQSSTRAFVPDKSKETGIKGDTGKTSSVLPGGLLGLLSYDTDSDDEKDEINTRELGNEKHEKVKNDEKVKNGYSHNGKVDGDTRNMEKMVDTSSLVFRNTDSTGRRVIHEGASGTNGNDRKQQNGTSSLDMKNNLRDEEQGKKDHAKETSSLELTIASDGRDSETKISPRKSPVTEAVTDRVRENKKEDQSRVKYEEKNPNKGKSNDRNGSKDRMKDGSRIDEKQKDSTSRKRSHYDDEDRKELERSKDKKREQLDDDKSDISRHKHSSNSIRHSRGHSSSPSRRRKNKSDSSVSGSSTYDESLDDSGRKSGSRRRPRSPSLGRSRKRQVSRSPEHSQRRHSPNYSLEGSRRKRSRSRSPRRRR